MKQNHPEESENLFNEFRERLYRTPFEPFRVHTTSGAVWEVPTADHAGVVPKARTIHIWSDDVSLSVRTTTIAPNHISAIEPLPRRHRRRKRAA